VFVRIGIHLPLADFGAGRPTGEDLLTYTRTARDLGYPTVAANDHLVWRHPWLDGPTTLASVVSAAGDMTLATSITLPVVRHPVVVAKMLTTLACLAQGPVVGGLGPGSSSADYAAVGVPFAERWARFDEALRLVRALVRGEPTAPGKHYAAELRLAPIPDRVPQVWFGSWGSDRRLAAMAAVADGWFASAYNATPDQYRNARLRLDDHLRAAGREPDDFPDAIATMWLFVTDSRREAEHVLTDVLAPALNRDPAQLVHLPIGSAQHCSEVLAGYAAAGAREVLLWPVRDNLHQLERAMQAAAPL
jgi:alkanesulfonate monooxygenase SsuD/methylene tetrahydromethanopterin reductase-like flavin-dependent oxidoreductase (luciferase family)